MEYLLSCIILGIATTLMIIGLIQTLIETENGDYTLLKYVAIGSIAFGLLYLSVFQINNKPKQPTEIVMFADVNQDGEIDISDMAIIKSHLLGIRQMNEQQLKIADVNKDGEINQIDLEIIRAVILSSNGYEYEFNN